MATAAGFTTDPAEFGKYHANAVVTPERVGPGIYLVAGARSFAVTNLSSDGLVDIDGVAMPQGFGYESATLPVGQIFSNVTITVAAGGEAFISRTV